MDNKNIQKANWLIVTNIGLGIISFILGLAPLILFVFATVDFLSVAVSPSLIENFASKFVEWVLRYSPVVVTTISFVSGLATLIIGFFASMLLENRKQRGISFIGTILGSLGMVGSASFLIFFLSQILH